MNKYIGTFKNADDSVTTVTIMPSNGNYDEETEIKFPFDEPVVITQESDGIFTPVKTKSCTIRIFTEEIYWELYGADPTEWSVKVDTQEGTNYPFNLFTGYLTPCIFSQDYAYNGILELEAVDCLAVLGSIKYKLYNANEGKQILDCGDIVFRNIFEKNLPNYSYRLLFYTDDSIYNENENGNIYISGYYSSDDNILYRYKLQESNFFNDENEPMNCKDILEEICKYLGISIMMYNGYIVFIDYNNLINLPHTESNLLPSKYGGGTPTIELDDVYSKIGINCDLYEVDDIVYDFFDDDYANTIYNSLKQTNTISQHWVFSHQPSDTSHTTDDTRYEIFVKPYNFFDRETVINKKKGIVGKWKKYRYSLTSNSSTPIDISSYWEDYMCTATNLTDTDSNNGNEINNAFTPLYRTVIPIKQFIYKRSDDTKVKATWNEYLMFPMFTQSFFDLHPEYKKGKDDRYLLTNVPSPQMNYLVQPVLEFSSDEIIPYSIQGGTNWFVFNADLFYEDTNLIPSHKNHDIYYNDNTDTQRLYPFCFDDFNINISSSDKQNWAGKGLSEYPLLKCRLQIGDKYWKGDVLNFGDDAITLNTGDNIDVDGNKWVDEPTDFYILYSNPNQEKNKTGIPSWTWLEPKTNTDYTQKVGKNGFAIPIKEEDKICGKLKLTIYSPYPAMFKNAEHDYNDEGEIISSIYRYNLFPVVWMKDLSLDIVYTDNTKWDDDVQVQDDIVYETVVDNTYLEDDDTTLKINSWYENKPISRSYVLDSDNLPIKNTYHIDINEETGLYKSTKVDGSTFYNCLKIPQESYLLTKYYAHYHKPKKILNLNYNTSEIKPFELYNHQSTNTKYFADSYTLDVRKAQSQIKFIEL